MSSVSTGTLKVGGKPLAISGGPWTLGDIAKSGVRVARVHAYSIQTVKTWDATQKKFL